MTALVAIYWADRLSLACLPYAAIPGTVWLTEAGPVRVTPTGRVERLGRSR